MEEAVERVSERLNDGHSKPFYRRAFRRVQAGEIPVARVLSAWKLARSGSAKCPGSVFVATLKGDRR